MTLSSEEAAPAQLSTSASNGKELLMKISKYAVWPILLGTLSIPLLMDCGAAKDLQQAASGCDELEQGTEATSRLDVDANVKAFVTATAELKAVVAQIKVDVKAACVDIDNRLGIADTWSALGDDDASISNGMGTGACDKAAAEIDAIMRESKATANFALMVTSPKCTIDADVQAACEANCKVDTVCTPGKVDVVTRCDPAQLSVQCGGTCNVNAVCEGTAQVTAQCEGTCDAMCKGHCTGTCVFESGTTMDNVDCTGKCKGHCKGSCDGECHIDLATGVACGTTATCRGGCTGTVTAPQCETELKPLPPDCHADTICQANCSAMARSNMHCEEPRIVLIANVNASPKIGPLKAAIEANFPKLVLAAKTKGPMLLKAVQDVAATGQVVLNNANSLGGKSLACAAAAGQVAASASVTVNVTVQGSSKVEGSCSSNQS